METYNDGSRLEMCVIWNISFLQLKLNNAWNEDVRHSALVLNPVVAVFVVTHFVVANGAMN